MMMMMHIAHTHHQDAIGIASEAAVAKIHISNQVI